MTDDLIHRSLVKHYRDLLLDQANKAMPDNGDEELDHGHRMYRAGIRDLARRLMLAPAHPVQEPQDDETCTGCYGSGWDGNAERFCHCEDGIAARKANDAVSVQEPPGPGVTAGAAEDEAPLAPQLTGRARFLRDRGEIKTPELLERAAKALTPAPVVPADQRAAIEALADRMWRVHPKDIYDAGYEHRDRGGRYDNPRSAWYADQIEALFKEFRDQVSPVVPAEGLAVERVEMVDWSSGSAEPADPIWRIVINGQCADFPSEAAARNFAAQIAALRSAPPQETPMTATDTDTLAARLRRALDGKPEASRVVLSRSSADALLRAVEGKPVTTLADAAPVVPAEGLDADFGQAFRLIYEAYSCPADRFTTDASYSEFLRGKVTKAFSLMQALRSAPPVGARVTGWQPIETAPKDGSSIIATTNEYAEPLILRWLMVNGRWAWRDWDTDSYINVTHWMPLPEPPAALLPAGEGE